jgi:hypothetical protein
MMNAPMMDVGMARITFKAELKDPRKSQQTSEVKHRGQNQGHDQFVDRLFE